MAVPCAEGLVTSIGVSNFPDDHIAALRGATPVVNQDRTAPDLGQPGLWPRCTPGRSWWSQSARPGGRPDRPGRPRDRRGQWPHKPAQGSKLAHPTWAGGDSPLVASATHQAENLDIFDFELSDEQMELIDSMTKANRPDLETGVAGSDLRLGGAGIQRGVPCRDRSNRRPASAAGRARWSIDDVRGSH